MAGARMFARVVVVLAVAVTPLVSLAGTLTVAGGKVEVTTDEERANGCEFVGEVVARPPYFLPGDWRVQLQNAAAEAGGDTVVHKPIGAGNVRGAVYRCALAAPTPLPSAPSAPSAPAAPAAAGCTKDTDCKGDRICDEGACRDP